MKKSRNLMRNCRKVWKFIIRDLKFRNLYNCPFKLSCLDFRIEFLKKGYSRKAKMLCKKGPR